MSTYWNWQKRLSNQWSWLIRISFDSDVDISILFVSLSHLANIQFCGKDKMEKEKKESFVLSIYQHVLAY